ncbi:unnamed protein product [Heligmosomoides polygyrus]|uniref:Uncharacterized protein n=1 Tax=Heligmosomoides polygyrus TaxID=6339 RepID=A0A183GEA4_HELPZ|nr:unnamed protein product [Heligmosomoides polygyrus]
MLGHSLGTQSKHGTEPHSLSRRRPIRLVRDSYESMFMAKYVRVDEDTNAAYSPAVTCSEEQQFFPGVEGSG